MQDETMAQRLKRLREAKKLSQTGLAALSGVGQSAIGNIEADIRGYGSSVVAIARALGTTPEYLQLKTNNHGQLETGAAQEMSPDARTVASIFDWLSDSQHREEVRVIMTQAVLARLRGRSDDGAADSSPQETPKTRPKAPVRAKK